MAVNSQYSDGVVAGMQMVYGEGFLSPGGPGEVAQLLAGLDPAGMRVLDIGCGLGGFALMLVRDHGAAHVTGIDIEPELVARATAAVNDAGLYAHIAIRQVEPGPLPLDAESFDLVVTKDVICHMPDKAAVFAEIHRVLRPGGAYLCADFYNGAGDEDISGEARAAYDSYVAGIKVYGLSFIFEPRLAYETALASAGFDLHEVRDHTAASVQVAEKELSTLTGEKSETIRQALGDERYQSRHEATTRRNQALGTRGLQHGHIHARKPG